MTRSGAATFELDARTHIVFGPNSADRAGELAAALGLKHVLLVTDQGIVAAGHVTRVERSLLGAGMKVRRFAEVRENPTTEDVERCLEVAREGRLDGILAVGGGSSLDTAKGCNFLYSNGGRMEDYWGVGKAPRPMLPWVAIPTTAGTGSEVQSFALITSASTHQKMACGDKKALARLAILDPTLTVSQPRAVAVCTGLDAITHAVETAVTSRRTPLSGMFSLEAFRRGIHALPRVLEEPDDLSARADMLWAAACSGMAIEASMLGAAHSCANPLTARFDVVHGQAVGTMLPHVVRFNAQDPRAARRYAELLSAAGLLAPRHDGGEDELREAALSLAGQLDELLRRCALPRDLRALGVSADAIPELARLATEQWTAQFNPRPLTEQDFVDLYAGALG